MWLVTNLCFPARAGSKQQRNEIPSFGGIKTSFSFVVPCCDACLEHLDITSTSIDQNMNDNVFSFPGKCEAATPKVDCLCLLCNLSFWHSLSLERLRSIWGHHRPPAQNSAVMAYECYKDLQVKLLKGSDKKMLSRAQLACLITKGLPRCLGRITLWRCLWPPKCGKWMFP